MSIYNFTNVQHNFIRNIIRITKQLDQMIEIYDISNYIINN